MLAGAVDNGEDGGVPYDRAYRTIGRNRQGTIVKVLKKGVIVKVLEKTEPKARTEVLSALFFGISAADEGNCFYGKYAKKEML